MAASGVRKAWATRPAISSFPSMPRIMPMPRRPRALDSGYGAGGTGDNPLGGGDLPTRPPGAPVPPPLLMLSRGRGSYGEASPAGPAAASVLGEAHHPR